MAVVALFSDNAVPSPELANALFASIKAYFYSAAIAAALPSS